MSTVRAAAYRPPRTPSEEILCGLFADLLDVPRVGLDDDFFGLGGHSLLAARLVSRARRALGGELDVRDLFETPTVAGLSARLAGSRPTGPALVRRAWTGPVPLSAAQRRLWFLNRLGGPEAGYLVPVALRLRGSLDRAALRQALFDVVARHEPLRTVLLDDEGVPRQHVVPPDAVHLSRDSVACPEADLAEALRRAAADNFDLSTELPFRVRLFTLGPAHHALLLLAHHVATDGWSMPVLMRDLAIAYAARVKDAAPGWDPLPVRYADYALWHEETVGAPAGPGEAVDRDGRAGRWLDFWRAQLAGVPPELTLPVDRPRSAATGHVAGSVCRTLDPALCRRLADVARAGQATLFMVLQAAFATTLTRLGAGSDIPIGVPVAGRPDEALDDLVGFFVNTIVLRTDTSGDPSFRELLTRVRTADLAAYAHQDLPFERLVEELKPARSLTRHPLFQVMLTLNVEPPAVPDLPGLAVEAIPIPAQATEFDLILDFQPVRVDGQAPSLAATLTYRRDLFDWDSAERLTDRLVRVLDAVSIDPATPLSRIDILDPAERHRILHDWNDTRVELPPATLPALFTEQVARTPDAVAVVFEKTQLTYRQLDERAERLARVLVARGAGRDRVVAVALPRSVDLIVAVYATHKAGAAYLPIDPDYPPDRVAFMRADARAVITLTPAVLAELAAAPVPASTALPVVTPPEAAYVIYTSGSTGRPKGVIVPHAGIVNRLLWMQARFGLTPRDRVVQKTPSSFDVSVWEFFWPLMVGATMVVARPGGHRDPEYLADLISRERVTVAHFVPSILEAFVETPGSADCAGLHMVVCSGEALPTDLARRWAARSPAALHNLYGPTEASVDVTSYTYRPDDVGPTVPIGRPVWNTQVYVLDAALQPVPPGVAGELYLAGVQLATGYLNRPELTAERFLPSPFGPPGTRMYRTGDLARWRADGILEYLGRTDGQVKVRGIRVETGEINEALIRRPDIAKAVTVLRPGEQRLVSYVVPVGPGSADQAAVRRELSATLPEYMVPAAVVSIAALPLTPSGKLDQRALPTPDFPAPAGGRAPRNDLEERLCRAFAEILDRPAVTIDDNFFDLGGHSLLAIRLVSRIRRELDVDLGIRSLFETPTVAGIAARRDDAGGDPLAVLLPIRTTGRRSPLFCFHPAAGVAWVYSGMLRHLDPDRPVHGLQARGLNGRDRLAVTFDDLVEDYLGQLRQIRPTGPYHLLGWSFGALVAHAVATRLQALGEPVATLTMMDGYPHATQDTAGLAEDDPRLRAELEESLGGVSAGGEQPATAAMARIFANNVRLAADFDPVPFDGDLLFFAATADKAGGGPVPDEWQPYVTGAVEVHEVHCAHGALTRPESLAVIGPTLGARLSGTE